MVGMITFDSGHLVARLYELGFSKSYTHSSSFLFFCRNGGDRFFFFSLTNVLLKVCENFSLFD